MAGTVRAFADPRTSLSDEGARTKPVSGPSTGTAEETADGITGGETVLQKKRRPARLRSASPAGKAPIAASVSETRSGRGAAACAGRGGGGEGLRSALSAALRADGAAVGLASTALIGVLCGMPFSVGLMQRERAVALSAPVALAAVHLFTECLSAAAKGHGRAGSGSAVLRAFALLTASALLSALAVEGEDKGAAPFSAASAAAKAVSGASGGAAGGGGSARGYLRALLAPGSHEAEAAEALLLRYPPLVLLAMCLLRPCLSPSTSLAPLPPRHRAERMLLSASRALAAGSFVTVSVRYALADLEPRIRCAGGYGLLPEWCGRRIPPTHSPIRCRMHSPAGKMT